MAEVSVGTARIDLAMDASSMEAVMSRVRQQQQGLGDIAQQEASKMTAAQRRVVTSLERQAQKVGLTREEWLKYRIITQTTGDTQKQLLALVDANTAGITRQGKAMEKTVNAVNKYGLTGKQQVAAMRQVPAQMTDIFVSLQGGQRPMTVLIQQGGQLKDVFGGVVPAAKALGSQVLAMINPLTLAGAAVATLAFAWHQGEGEARKFNAAIINSGNFARTSAPELARMAEALDQIEGVTRRAASGALVQMVATGRIAKEQLEAVTEAALRLERAGGQSVEETAKAFADIARDPVSAIMKLNESMNFLDRTTLDTILTLQEQGRTQEAIALATETYSATVIERSKQISENLGYLETAWQGVKRFAAEAWDEMLGVGRARDPADVVADARNRLQVLTSGDDPNTKYWSAERRQREVDRLQGIIRENQFANVVGRASGTLSYTDTKEYKDAFDGWAAAANAARTDVQKLNDELAEIERQGIILGKTAEEIAKLQDAARAKADRGGAGGVAGAASKAALQAIKDQETVLRAEIANSGKVLQAEYAARLVSEEAYFNQRRELAQRDFHAQEASLQQQIAHLRQRSVSGKDAITNAQELGKAEAQLAKIRADHATQQIILGIQEDTLSAKRQRAIDSYGESLDKSNQAAQRSVESQLARIMYSQREAEQLEDMAALTERYAEEQRKLARELAETNDEAVYQEKLALLKAWMDEQVRIVREGYDLMREAEADWRNGMAVGLRNWMDGAANVAKQTEAITVKSLDGAVDMLTTFATTSKLTWRALLADIGEQIVRFMMKQAVLQFLQYFMGAWTGNSGNVPMGMTDMGSTNGPYYAAKGDAFPGAAGLSKHSGTVVDKPTPFYFAKGAGVMGEAGMEGIFPLERGADGKLGVKAIGGGGMMAPVYVTTNVYVSSDGERSETQTAGEQSAMYREFAATMSNVAKKEIVRANMPGGILWKVRN